VSTVYQNPPLCGPGDFVFFCFAFFGLAGLAAFAATLSFGAFAAFGVCFLKSPILNLLYIFLHLVIYNIIAALEVSLPARFGCMQQKPRDAPLFRFFLQLLKQLAGDAFASVRVGGVHVADIAGAAGLVVERRREVHEHNRGRGDDFTFVKTKRTNRIVTDHSQGRAINLLPKDYVSYSFDMIKENFVGKNMAFFKAVYFDFAPLLAIPIYQERPVHSLKPIPDYAQLYALKECEVLANALDCRQVVHPNTKTKAILKSSFVGSENGIDETCITAYSYDIEKRVDIIPMYGGDGRFHNVPVEWDDYLPLEASNHFYVSTNEIAKEKSVMARRNGLCIFQSK